MITNKTLSKIIAERTAGSSARFDPTNYQQAAARRAARALRLKSTVDARVKIDG